MAPYTGEHHAAGYREHLSPHGYEDNPGWHPIAMGRDDRDGIRFTNQEQAPPATSVTAGGFEEQVGCSGSVIRIAMDTMIGTMIMVMGIMNTVATRIRTGSSTRRSR